jgi:aromatic ring-opening dioxygenase catalytic subunit (LigB family)
MPPHTEPGFTRRQAIAAGLAVTAAAAVLPAVGRKSAKHSPDDPHSSAAVERMPVAFVPHGGGPWPFVDVGIGDKLELEKLATYLRSLASLPKTTPKAVLVISAHWEESVPTVMAGEHPPMLYDYYGFPPESYQITWPAPGHPDLAARVGNLLLAAGINTATNLERGFDHGTFVPLKLAYPNADIPTVQLSLKHGLDPESHIALGRALLPLRDEGVFIIGSGMTYHNLRAFGPQSAPAAEAFDAWLRETALSSPEERDRRLIDWKNAPSARLVHPREEHLLPLMVIAGAAGSDHAQIPYNGTILGLRLSAYHFG